MLSVHGFGSQLFGPVDLTLQAGECATIEGPSGAGKSLLLRGLADLDVTFGDVGLDGRARSEFRPEIWRTSVGFVPAESGWWDDRVGNHFDVGSMDAFATLADALGFETGVLDWQVHRLSSGERHRLALIRTLLKKPLVLLLDEPTASLDRESVVQVEALIAKKLSVGACALIVTHDEDQPVRLQANRYYMSAGRLGTERPA